MSGEFKGPYTSIDDGWESFMKLNRRTLSDEVYVTSKLALSFGVLVGLSMTGMELQKRHDAGTLVDMSGPDFILIMSALVAETNKRIEKDASHYHEHHRKKK